MKILGYSFFDRNIEKSGGVGQDYTSPRPLLDLWQQGGAEGIRIPYLPVHMRILYDVAMYSDVLRNIIHSLKQELFRHGIEIEPKYVKKCKTCEKEFDKSVEQCDQCQGTEFIEPDFNQKKILEKIIKNVNENGQSLIDVSKMIEEDLEIIDDGYMLIIKDYTFTPSGEIIKADIKEVIRGYPIWLNMLADKTGRPGRDDVGRKVWTCLEHRENVWKDAEVCPICQKKLYQAFYRVQGQDGRYIYYTDGEIIHYSKYCPSLTYGFSPILSIWMKVITLMNEDKYIKDYYAKQRPPRGLLFINSPNIPSIEKAWNWMLDMWRKNPHMIPPIPVESGQKSGKFVEFIDFMKSLDDMQFTEVRNEFRRSIGSVYGVQPLFMGEGESGLKNEGLQIVVTTRAVENGQTLFNEKFYPALLKEMGITDWKLVLTPPERRDELMILQIKEKEIQNAKAMLDMGFGIKYNEAEQFEIEAPEEPIYSKQEASPFNPTQPTQEQRFDGEPEHTHESEEQSVEGMPRDVSRSLTKGDAPVTSNTPGAENPIFDKRRQHLKKIIKSVCEDYYITKDWSDWFTPGAQDTRLAFMEQNIYDGKFNEIGKEKSDAIKDVIMEGVAENHGQNEMLDKIKRIMANAKVKKSDGELTNIIRTEAHALKNKGREYMYLETDTGTEKYKWLGPTDDRTTNLCKRIKGLTEKGVTMDELRKIIDKEAKKSGFEPRDFAPHPCCRHTFVRV